MKKHTKAPKDAAFVTKVKKFTHRHLKNKKVRYGIILIIAIAGTSFIAFSSAATFFVTVEPENGTLNGVTKVSDGVNADGAIQFGTATSLGGLSLISPKSEITQLKQAVTTGDKKAYWQYVQGRPPTRVNTTYTPNWDSNVTYTFNGHTYTFNPKRFVSTETPTRDDTDTQGSFMMSAAQNAYGCALEYSLAGDQACGTHAMNILDGWSKNMTYVYCRPSGIDVRENQVKLWSGWSVPMFTKAAELMWDHPSFTPAMKTQFANWMWNTFLLQTANLEENDKEILGMSAVGWNGRMTTIQARLFAGLTMKAAGHPQGAAVVNNTISKLDSTLPEEMYYGKAPWHEVLGQPWPKQPYRHKSPTYSSWDKADKLRGYWQLTDTTTTPPPFFIGQVQETARDVGHTQMGAGALAETLKAMRLNGYGDRFAKSDLGDILLQLGEKHAKNYNEALDAYWASPNSFLYSGVANIEGLSCGWKPSGWDTVQAKPVTKPTGCPASAPANVTFKISGASADHGWELMRTELKRSGYSTPQLDKITTRLRGTGTRSGTKVAGFSSVDMANHMAWEPLFAPDYQ